MPYRTSPNTSAGGCFSAYVTFEGIKPLACTIFAPTYFGVILRKCDFHISKAKLKYFIMDNYLDFGLKIAHIVSHTLTDVRAYKDKIDNYEYTKYTQTNGELQSLIDALDNTVKSFLVVRWLLPP